MQITDCTGTIEFNENFCIDETEESLEIQTKIIASHTGNDDEYDRFMRAFVNYGDDEMSYSEFERRVISEIEKFRQTN